MGGDGKKPNRANGMMEKENGAESTHDLQGCEQVKASDMVNLIRSCSTSHPQIKIF